MLGRRADVFELADFHVLLRQMEALEDVAGNEARPGSSVEGLLTTVLWEPSCRRAQSPGGLVSQITGIDLLVASVPCQ